MRATQCSKGTGSLLFPVVSRLALLSLLDSAIYPMRTLSELPSSAIQERAWFFAFPGGVTFASAEPSEPNPGKQEGGGEPKLLIPSNAEFYKKLNLIPLLSASPFNLPELPWSYDSLAPAISAETVEYHFGRHHAGYTKNLNEFAAKDPSIASKSLEELVKTATPGPVFNNAAQLLNHTFFWRSMSPHGGGPPHGEVKGKIAESFGSWEELKKQMTKAALQHFGSGWIWLVVDDDGKLGVVEGHDAQTPIRSINGAAPSTPLLTIDIWEHAYYIDFKNARAAYVEKWFGVVNWNFANHNLDKWLAMKKLTAEDDSEASSADADSSVKTRDF